MLRVIEIHDSDEEESKIEIPPSAKQQHSAAVTSMETEPVTTTTNTTGNVNDDSLKVNRASTSRRHRRRKSLQLVRPSADIEFETLALDLDTDDDVSANTVQRISPVKTLSKRRKKRTPNILSADTQNTAPDEILNEQFDEFLGQEATRELITEIAAERLRINTLLTMNGMPKINFKLGTQQETLLFQMENRFIQREIRRLSDANNLH